MSLSTRINRIEQALHGPGRDIWVFVHGCLGDFENEPGEIHPWGDGGGARMIVAAEHGLDPIEGLTPAQRAYLRPGDKVEAHLWMLEHPGPDSLTLGERLYTWNGFDFVEVDDD